VSAVVWHVAVGHIAVWHVAVWHIAVWHVAVWQGFDSQQPSERSPPAQLLLGCAWLSNLVILDQLSKEFKGTPCARDLLC
jgi:hypothetical protein